MSPIYSMTGFASCDGSHVDGRAFVLSIKAVNHRHLDLQMRLPSGLDALEAAMRVAIKAQVRRGHVEVALTLERATGAAAVVVNEALLSGYVAAVRDALARFGSTQEPDVNALLRLPGVMSAVASEVEVGSWEAPVLQALVRCLIRFQAARALEGEALAKTLREAIARVGALAIEAQGLRREVNATETVRLGAKLQTLIKGPGLTEERLLTEAALLVARSDIEEELVRLRTHVTHFLGMLDQGGEIGKQLDFLVQELHREANTMLSKSGSSASEAGLRLTDIGLAVKVELERIREQVQNLE